MQDLEHAVRQAGLLPQLGDQQGRGGIALGGLEDERVAGGDRNRGHPQRHHDREVERSDARHHAKGLAKGVHVDASGKLVGELPLELLSDPAGELDDLEAAAYLALGVREHFAVLGGDQPSKVVGVGGYELAELEQHRRALGQGHIAPRVRGLPRRRDGDLQVLIGGQVQDAGHLAGGGVVDLLGTVPGAAGARPVDKVLDVLDLLLGLLAHALLLDSPSSGRCRALFCW